MKPFLEINGAQNQLQPIQIYTGVMVKWMMSYSERVYKWILGNMEGFFSSFYFYVYFYVCILCQLRRGYNIFCCCKRLKIWITLFNLQIIYLKYFINFWLLLFSFLFYALLYCCSWCHFIHPLYNLQVQLFFTLKKILNILVWVVVKS